MPKKKDEINKKEIPYTFLNVCPYLYAFIVKIK